MKPVLIHWFNINIYLSICLFSFYSGSWMSRRPKWDDARTRVKWPGSSWSNWAANSKRPPLRYRFICIIFYYPSEMIYTESSSKVCSLPADRMTRGGLVYDSTVYTQHPPCSVSVRMMSGGISIHLFSCPKPSFGRAQTNLCWCTFPDWLRLS